MMDETQPFPKVMIGGMLIDRASRAQLAECMVSDCQTHRDNADCLPRLVFSCNGQALSLFASDEHYRQAVESADIIHADGQFVVWVSRLLGTPIAERSATTDMIHDCAHAAEQAGLSFYLLGGTEAVNAKVAARLLDLYPQLNIVGRHHGYFTPEQEESLVESIARAQPDILWVGLGKPKEQTFSVRWRQRLNAGWIVTCGGCYNYITGDYPRAPMFVQRIGMEWIYRALSDPRKFLWRYLTTTPHALWLSATRSRSI